MPPQRTRPGQASRRRAGPSCAPGKTLWRRRQAVAGLAAVPGAIPAAPPPPAPRAQHVPWRKAGFHFTARRKRWNAQFGPLPHSLSILPKGGRIDLLMSPERRKFLGSRPAHQRVVVLGLKSGEQAQPLSCSRGPSALRPVAPGVPRLCGGGYRSGCHKPDRPLSSRARCLPPGLLLHL